MATPCSVAGAETVPAGAAVTEVNARAPGAVSATVAPAIKIARKFRRSITPSLFPLIRARSAGIAPRPAAFSGYSVARTPH